MLRTFTSGSTVFLRHCGAFRVYVVCFTYFGSLFVYKFDVKTKNPFYRMYDFLLVYINKAS